MTETATVTKTAVPARRRWSTREILLTAVLGLAFGVIFIPVTYGYVALSALGPVFAWAMVGIWIAPAYFAAYVIRRPGAALLLMFIAGLVLIPGTPYGVAMVMSAMVYGIAAEVGCAIATRYKQWAWPQLLLAALIAGLIGLVVGLVLYRSFQFGLWVNILIAIVCVVSSLIGMVLAKLLADAVARTGMLSGVALGAGGKEI